MKTMTVSVTPTSAGAKSCTVSIKQGATVLTTVDVTATATAPVLTLSPTPPLPPFNNTEVGSTSATQTLTASNTGDAPLTISSAALTMTSLDFVVLSGSSGPITIQPGGTPISWTIACRPQSFGNKSGTFRILSNSSTGTTTDVPLSCTGLQGVLTAIPTSHNFGGVVVGTSVPFSFQIRNEGNVPIIMLAGALADTTKGYVFDPATVTPTTLNPGATKDLSVAFTPTSGASGGAVNLNFQGRWGTNNTLTSATLALNGDGQVASFTVTPSPLAFGNFRFDGQPQLPYHIKNIGDVNISIDSIAFTPDMGTTASEVEFSTVTTPQTLTPNQQIDVTVTLKPINRAGAIGGKVTVHSATTGTSDQQLTITGNATAATFTVTALTDFGPVDVTSTPPTKTVTIQNTSTAILDINSVAPQAGSSSSFTYMTLPTNKVQLAPNSKLDILVTYRPIAVRAMDDFDQAVLVATLGGVINQPRQAMLDIRGRGIGGNLLIDATPQYPATFRNPGSKAPVRAITLRNNGEAPLQITSAAVTDAPVWVLLDETFPVDIPGGGSHDFLVKFSPTEVGAAPQGQLTLTTSNAAQPQASVTLAGVCMMRNVDFGPQLVEFGRAVAGIAVTRTNALEVVNLDPAIAFALREIRLSDDTVFHLDDAPADLLLSAGSAEHFAISFESLSRGHFETSASLFLDEDPVPHADVKITADTIGSIAAHGGGGCAAGHGASLGAGLAFAMLALRRRRRTGALVIAIASLGATREARADDIVVGVFDPTPAIISSGFQLASPEVGPAGSWVASSVASYATDMLVLDSYDEGTRLGADHAIKRRAMLELGGAYAFLGRFEAGIRIPLYSQRGDAPTSQSDAVYIKPASGTALGDVTLHVKARLAQTSTESLGSITLGAALHATLPTATSGQFTGVDLPSIRLLGLAAWSPSARLSLFATAGGVLRKTSVYGDTASISQGSGLSWGAGASLRVLDRLTAHAEIFGELTRSGRREVGMNTLALAPVEGLAGARYRFDRGILLGVALGRGLTNGIGAPAVRGVVTLSYAVGLPPAMPLHPYVAPDPERDSDGDGIVDALDKCPRDAEDKDGFQDDDGCPDLDNDRDGIADARDKCPNNAEDKDGFQDDDGCPDPDNDGDGIADAVDKCPDQPETINGSHDEDGCPDSAEITSVAVDQRSATKAAEDTFSRGRELMKQGKYAAACAEFEQSQRLDPQLGTQYNLAGCYDKVGKLATARNMFRELARSDSNPTRRAKAAEQATILGRRTPRIKLVLTKTPGDVQVFMNGENANALIGIETPVNLGSYSIVVGASGYKAWRKTIDVREEGKMITVPIELEPLH